MGQLEVWCFRTLGVLLILLGLALFASPRIAWSTHERIPNTQYRVRREKAFLLPRPAAVLIAGAGLLVLILVRPRKASYLN